MVLEELKTRNSKQETLEEFTENYLNKFYSNYAFKDLLKPLLIDGAKWQAERMYSEEEVHIILNSYKTLISGQFLGKDNRAYYEWFEQFKKK